MTSRNDAIYRVLRSKKFDDADDEMFGFCLACREIRECTEPDAENYRCEVCGEDAVYGPHWILIAGLVE